MARYSSLSQQVANIPTASIFARPTVHRPELRASSRRGNRNQIPSAAWQRALSHLPSLAQALSARRPPWDRSPAPLGLLLSASPLSQPAVSASPLSQLAVSASPLSQQAGLVRPLNQQAGLVRPLNQQAGLARHLNQQAGLVRPLGQQAVSASRHRLGEGGLPLASPRR